MRNIFKISEDEKKELFRETSREMGIPEAIIEKDYWVCRTLDYLFHRSPWKKNLAFKGGTSLSKAYSLIERFSEDIDLILDYRILGYSKDEFKKERTQTKQGAFNQEVEQRTIEFLNQSFIPTIKDDIEKESGVSMNIYKNLTEAQTVNVVYPKIFADKSILEEIKLEIGALALWTPVRKQLISPYSAQAHAFEKSKTEVLTVTPERTFWEKLTILHHEANRPRASQIPKRYSRHYYDVYKISQSSVKAEAFEQKALLDEVAAFKNKFYYRSWARYDEAKIGTLKLMPPAHTIENLEKDYEKMLDMLFGAEKPTFPEIMDEIEKLEAEINSL